MPGHKENSKASGDIQLQAEATGLRMENFLLGRKASKGFGIHGMTRGCE